MKIAVIGGGSTYTPELVDGFARLRGEAGLDVDELVLVDPAADRLAVVGPFSARIFGHYGNPGRVTWTSTVDDGLAGADVVIIQLRVGGHAGPRRAQPPHLGTRRLRRRRGPAAGVAGGPRRRPGRAGGTPRGSAADTRQRSVVLSAVLLQPRPRGSRGARPPVPRATGRRD